MISKCQDPKLHPKGHRWKCEDEVRGVTAASSGMRVRENSSLQLLSRTKRICNQTGKTGFCPLDKYLLVGREQETGICS